MEGENLLFRKAWSSRLDVLARIILADRLPERIQSGRFLRPQK